MNEKQHLRAEMRKARYEFVETLSGATRWLILRRPPAPVAAMIPEDAVIGLYHATPSEAQAGGYARWFAEQGHRIALPAFASRNSPMHFREWRDAFGGGDLVDGPYGVQPCDDADTVIPNIVFVPLLAFTAECARLGQGGGHYDRWLAANRQSKAIGLAWDIQKVDTLPMEAHDLALSAVVTPTRIYWNES